MSLRARDYTGVITTLFFGGVGAMMLAEGQTTFGVVLVALACLRGLLTIQHFLAARER